MTRHLTKQMWLEQLAGTPSAERSPVECRALYSSYWDAIVTDPALMMVPIEDHLVHRGDGVFEALKFSAPDALYLFESHLDRLKFSASQLSLTPPIEWKQLPGIIADTISASGLSQGFLRIFLSRGPGGFSVNPYDSKQNQIYIAVLPPKNLPERWIKDGVRAGLSRVPVKDGFFAQIKSCNYLQNVLMKKEAVDRGLDFVIGLGKDGYLTEGASENMGLISAQGELLVPRFETVLRGTTLVRVMQLTEQYRLASLIENRNLSGQDLLKAREVFLTGTTLDILSVSEWEGHRLGACGEFVGKMRDLLARDAAAG